MALLSEFSRSDLMLARRGFLGSSLALSAGPSLIEPMQRWLVPSPSAPLAPPEAEPVSSSAPRPRPPVQAGAGPAGDHHRDVPAVGRPVRRRPAPQGVVGQLHEVTDLLQEPQPEATTRRLFKVAAELAQLAGWMSYDVGLQPTAQKYFVLALHAAKEAGDRPLGSTCCPA
ncbi:hypothetical protein GCM10023238_18050 [Streptomyces heliomycini]